VNKKIFGKNISGFTLIELLIVIAILGTLAVVVLLALNPVQQLARTRDAGRISTITQLGHALEAFATSNNGNYVAESVTWIGSAPGSLVGAGEIAAVPGAISYSVAGIAACAVNPQNGFCYDATTALGGGPFIAFARLESQSNITRCIAKNAAFVQAYAIYVSALGQGGVYCGAGVPTVGTAFGPANML
jgi:prepilin-type N-terminal cleavage/methylation domain-containing protein